MPKKKATTTTLDPEEKPTRETVLYYAGREFPDVETHLYLEPDGTKRYFVRKLKKHHRVGQGYPFKVYVRGDQHSFMAAEPEWAVDGWKNAAQVAEWTKSEQVVVRELQRRKDKASLRSVARKAAQEFKAVYKRADFLGRAEMINALIEELES